MAANTVSKNDLVSDEQIINSGNGDATGSATGLEQHRTKRRSPTLLKLQWLAERLRKVERIKRQVAEGTYHADSHDIAKAILNIHENQLNYPSPAEACSEEDV